MMKTKKSSSSGKVSWVFQWLVVSFVLWKLLDNIYICYVFQQQNTKGSSTKSLRAPKVTFKREWLLFELLVSVEFILFVLLVSEEEVHKIWL